MDKKLDRDLYQRVQHSDMFSRAVLPRAWDRDGDYVVQNCELRACNERWRTVPFHQRHVMWDQFKQSWVTETQGCMKVRPYICMHDCGRWYRLTRQRLGYLQYALSGEEWSDLQAESRKVELAQTRDDRVTA